MFTLRKFPILFSTVKLKLGHNFSQSIFRFKIWILKSLSWAIYASTFFPIHERDRKLGFLNTRFGRTSNFFSIH